MQSVIFIIAAVASITAFQPGGARAAVPGHAILAKPTGDALVIWDASNVVGGIVRSTMSDDAANRLIELDSQRVLATILPTIDKHAKSVTVRAVYSKIGAVSPVYGTPTFAGVEHFSELSIDASGLKRWKRAELHPTIAPWFHFNVVGKLPPRVSR